MQPADPYRPNQPMRPSNTRKDGVTVDAARLWAGGVAAAVVAAGVAVVGLLIARGIFDTTVLIPDSDGALVNANTWRYALGAAIGALLATALMHLLLMYAPSPRTFFVWIIGLAIAAAVVAPFASDANVESKIAVAAINLAIGIAVMTTILSVARSTASVSPRS
jgi:Family of unknown function (DUF6069)